MSHMELAAHIVALLTALVTLGTAIVNARGTSERRRCRARRRNGR